MNKPDHDLFEQLKSFDTPTICNAIELFDIRPRNQGFMNDRIKACFPDFPPTVGYAATATFRSAAPPRQGDLYADLSQQVERFVELDGPPIVVFQDLDDPPIGATFGEVMCTTYQAYGAQGIITSGAGRDLDQVQSIKFPAFTSGTICAHGYCHIPQIHVPVNVGGITIFPNDLLHADLNGVTTVPIEIAGEVAEVAGEFGEAESIVLNLLHQGSAPSIKQFIEARKEMGDRIAQLRKRVSRQP